MRLTLRTLLAWLDDTLPPSEVRQIGQQVAETPLAQELVDRIHRVARQRRLTVPSGTGHDGVDPNVVAEYLGDVLSPELVAEYEKRCLTSDVTLAEVASVHQILSLLGQKAKVPPEARQRMYHLVRGRETVVPAAPRAQAPPRSRPATEPISAVAWTPPPKPARSWVERYGLAVGAVALIAVLFWSAWMSVGTGTKPGGPDLAAAPIKVTKPAAPGPAPRGDDARNPAVAPDARAAIRPVEKPGPMPEPDAKDKSSDKAAAAPAEEIKADEPKAELPAGAAGVVGKGDGVLLRYNPDTRGWDRLISGAVLRDGDRIVNLPPFHAPLQIGAAGVTMVGDGELKILAAGAGASSRFDVTRGRVRIVGSAAKEPIAVPFDSGLVKISVPTGAVAGLERVNARAPGDKVPAAPGLRITSAEGTVTVESGATSEPLATGVSILFHAPNVFSARIEEPIPAWISDSGPSAADQERGKALARYFTPDALPIRSLLEAAEDPNADVRQDAVTAMGGIASNLDLVIATMSKKDDPVSRKAAIAVLREAAMRDAESAKLLRSSLEQTLGSKDLAETAETLLVGYSNKEASEEAVQAKLLALLKHDDVGIRELAIDALQAISRRADRLGYDPDKPADIAGIKAWQDLVQRNELRAPVAPK